VAKRTVVWTRTADIQFVGTLEYWAKVNQSKVYSIKLLKMVTERTNQIAENPLLFKSTNFKDVRVASLGNYSIFYKAHKEEVIIMAFWDNRQAPKKLLKALRNKK
jgi:hypothetical protein